MSIPRSVTLLVAAVVLAGCGFLPQALPEPECAEPGPGPPPALTCEAGVRAAVAALPGSHPRVTSLWFQYGTPCPPGARCAFVPVREDIGTVIITFANGDQLSVRVRVEAGLVHADAPEAYPPAGRAL
jgi:hypothetical protein